MTALPGKRMRGRKRTVVIILRLKIPKIRTSLLERASHQKMLPRKVERPLMEKAKKRRIKKLGIKNPKTGEAKAKETRERETREKTAKGKPSKRIVKVGILPEKSRKKEKKRKTESPQDRGKEKSGKLRKRGMIFLRNGKILANERSRKSNIPLKKNKKNRGVWPGFCVWNRRNIRIFEIFSGGSPWIGKRWKWIWIPLTMAIITMA